MMRDDSHLYRDLSLVYAVSLADVIFSIIANLLIPLQASKPVFASYKMVVLYAGYAGILHFGLLNGFYLYVIGKSTQQLDWELVRRIKRNLITLQVVLIPILVFVLLLLIPDYKLIIIVVGWSWGVLNLVTFYNYLSQGTSNFRVYALIALISKAISIIILLGLWITHSITDLGLVVSYVIPPIATLVQYFLWERRVYSVPRSVRSVVSPIFPFDTSLINLWKRGIVLYVANICISFMFSIDNMVVSFLFRTNDFATYTFAYGISSIAYLGVDGLTTVVTPYVAKFLQSAKSGRQERSQGVYVFIIWVVPFTFWGASVIIERFYPHYVDAVPLLIYFFSALPLGVVIRSRIASVTTAGGKEKLLLRFAITGFVIALIFVLLAYFIGHTINSVAMGWALAMFITMAVIGRGYLGDRLPTSGLVSESWLMGNSICACIAFLLCASLQGWPSLLLYAIISSIAVFVAFVHMKAAQKNTTYEQ